MEQEVKKEVRIDSNPMIRWILLISGILLTAIGVIGMFVPLLPTTIFLILAAWCFARSSAKFHKWLHSNRLFGKYLSDYRSGKGMTIKSKIYSLSMLFLGIGYSIIFATDVLYVRVLLATIAIGVGLHLIMIRTQKK